MAIAQSPVRRRQRREYDDPRSTSLIVSVGWEPSERLVDVTAAKHWQDAVV
jgi:hypothetical protein